MQSSQANRNVNIPPELYCPISGQIFKDPVVTEDGHTFEREAIKTWLEGNNRNPLTNNEMKNKTLIANWSIKSAVERFLQEHPELADEQYISTELKNELNTILWQNKATSVQAAERIFQNDPRFLTIPLKDDYCALHIAAQFGSAALSEKYC